jgi:glycosyltransferase involved in cell wall biosynthesis
MTPPTPAPTGPAPRARPSIGAAIIARNEAARLERCLRSLSWVDEIVLIDDCSTDGTADLARGLGCRVITRAMRDFAEQRNFALTQVSTDWVLHLDADEECTPGLRDEIVATLPGTACAGFRMPRRNRFLGRIMLGRDWSGTILTRLAIRTASRWERPVHEKLLVEGEVGDLRGWIDHHGDTDYAERVRKSNRYTTIEAEILRDRGMHFRLWRLCAVPLAKCLKSYLWDGGWRDGVIGCIWAGHVWWGNFAIHVKLWELERTQRTRTEAGRDA